MNTDSPINRVEQVQVDDLACWRIHTAHGEALIAQQGAQLLSYQPHEQPPLVWLSDEAGYRRGQSVRGGVPVCWPWFGPLERNPQEVRGQVEDGLKAPAHGLVRAVDWEIDDIAEEDGDLCVSFRLDAPPRWPPRLAAPGGAAHAVPLRRAPDPATHQREPRQQAAGAQPGTAHLLRGQRQPRDRHRGPGRRALHRDPGELGRTHSARRGTGQGRTGSHLPRSRTRPADQGPALGTQHPPARPRLALGGGLEPLGGQVPASLAVRRRRLAADALHRDRAGLGRPHGGRPPGAAKALACRSGASR